MRDRGVRDEAKSIPWASASPSLPPSLWLTSQCSDKGPKEERSGENVDAEVYLITVCLYCYYCFHDQKLSQLCLAGDARLG